jgi:4-amino-4-deoxy-L-arabinose transferase-like glycosyltransferase
VDKWIVVALPLLWYGPAGIVWGRELVNKQLFDENIRRFTGGFGLPQSLDTLIGPSLTEAAPWSLFLVIALARHVASGSWNDGTRYLTCWWVTTLVFFSLSVGKRTIYLLPLYPAAALLGADQAWRFATRLRTEYEPARFHVRPVAWASLAAACLAAVVLTGMARLVSPNEVPPPPDPSFEIVYFFQFFVLQHPVMTACMVAAALVTLLGAILRARVGAWGDIPLLVAVSLVPFYVFVFPLVRDEHKQIRSVKEFGLEVAATVPREASLYFYRYGSKELPGYLYFYVGRDVPSAPCAQFRGADCPPAYYLMWQRDWHVDDPSLEGRAEELLRSADTAIFPRYAPFVLVRLRGEGGA